MGAARERCLFRRNVALFVLIGLVLLPGCSKAPQAVSAEPEQEAELEHRAAGAHRNRLADETSPYLLLHAHNPVNWFPWGEEALEKARKEKKLIFLSIGYSSCHWCHVMERESFMDEEIAALMNEHFVCIKVDREERPDVDIVYMTALQIYNQAMGGGRSGGWPLSMFLTPDARPFFGGTYFPARDGDRGARVGFLTVLQKIHEIWREQPDRVEQDANTLTQLVKRELEGGLGLALQSLDANLLEAVQEELTSQYDADFGGFGFEEANPQRPKFPEPSNLYFLLYRMQQSENEQARQMLVRTLQRMAMGGIRDHVGGGFHRYSVDRYWRIPHFEKMLYDNGQLASVFAQAYAATDDESFRRITDELLDFVLREMTHPEGGFYTALDAESEGEEGKYYRWSRAEVQKILGADYDLVAKVYGFDLPPNFEERFYVPQLHEPLTETAERLKLDEHQLDEKLQVARQKLLDYRDRRSRPLTDTKVLTGWNGLMIRGLADAGRLFQEPKYIAAGERAADFVLEHLRAEDGRLRRTYSQGEAKLEGYLDDYAFLIDGLIALHEATGDENWLTAADQLMQQQIELFWDAKGGGFFFTGSNHESLLARIKQPVDSALPSGNSVSAENLVYLAKAVERPEYLEYAEKTVASASGVLAIAPAAAPRMAVAWDKVQRAKSAE